MPLPKAYRQFSYDAYEIDQFDNELRFYYSVDDELYFVHSIQLDLSAMLAPDCPHILLEHAVFTLGIAELLNYYKAFCCPFITIKAGYLTSAQIEFWKDLFMKGLGEFFYVNQIDYRNIFQITCESKNAFIQQRLIQKTDQTLIMLGGGKDSLVTGQICIDEEMPFSWFSLITHVGGFKANTAQERLIQRLADTSAVSSRYVIARVLDEQIIMLNAHGAYNGHVPISAVFALTAVIVGILERFTTIYASNERSANIGNVEYLGMMINHQYTKSFEFEQALHKYVKQYISPDIRYVSFLRPLYEIQISRLFSQMEKFHALAISCNKGMKEEKWCLECPKCAFVFVMMHAFLSTEDVTRLFGANIYENMELKDLFWALLGKGKIKPFDCVGTFEEMQVGMYMSMQWYEKNHYPSILEAFSHEILPTLPEIEHMKQTMQSAFNEEHLLNEKEIRMLKKYL